MNMDIYCRKSDEDSSDLDEQEAEGLAWAARHGIEIGEIIGETAYSGDADDRRLGELIARCERGESGGIIVFDERRFARDPIAGGVALDRLVECDARLVASRSGFDSANLTPEMRMIFDIMMAIGKAERTRNRLRRTHGKRKAAERGEWCGGAPPVGYDLDDDGRLVPNQDADTVREIFRLRAEGLSCSAIVRAVGSVTATDMGGHKGKGRKMTREHRPLTRGGVRHVIGNRVYLGIQTIPNPLSTKDKRLDPTEVGTADEPKHTPLVTRQEFEAANAVPKSAPPPRLNLVELYGAELKGVIRCSECRGADGHPSVLHVLKPGRYACCRCGKTAITVATADRAVAAAFKAAIESGGTEVMAIANDASAYDDALEAVERAAATLAEYRDSTELQAVLGVADWTAGLRVRKESYELARRSLRERGPAPRRITDMRKLLRESLHPYLAEVLVYPKRSDGPRLTLRWKGAEVVEAVL